MKPICALSAIMALAGVLVLAAAPAGAAPQAGNNAAVAPSEVSAQSRTRRPRLRPQLRVQPRYYYRTFSTPYPLPYDIEYPGPNGKRYCSARYLAEYRPSGTVVVPRMRCWWGPG